MKCLSVPQPWAWAILHAGMDVENRTWWTEYRGPILIHASKRYDAGAADEILGKMDLIHRAQAPNGIPGRKLLPRGGIVGQAVLVGCVKHSDSLWFRGRRRRAGARPALAPAPRRHPPRDEQPFGWLLREVEELEFIPWPGRLGLFDFPDELVPRLRPV
jgi:hypothetical protein